MKFILLLISFIFTVQSASVEYKSCREKYVMEVTEMNAMPWPPISGLNTMYFFKTHLGFNVTKLYMNMKFEMRVGINQWENVVNETIDLCNGIIKCPMSVGDYDIPYIHTIPSNSPAGFKWRGHVYFRNEKDVELGCIELKPFKVK